MSVRVPTTDPLLEFLSGKRIHKRYVVSIPVVIGGATGRFKARATDLSIGGAQITMTEKALGNVMGDAHDVLGAVSACLADGFDVHFGEQGLVLEAELVRLSVEPDTTGVFLAGCRFVEALTEGQQIALGLKKDTSSTLEEAPLEPTPFVAGEGRALSILLYGQDAALVGPRFVGRIAGYDKQRLTLDIGGTDPRELREALGEGVFAVAIADPRGGLWHASARLHRLQFDDHCSGGVAVALQLDEALPRALRRTFRRR